MAEPRVSDGPNVGLVPVVGAAAGCFIAWVTLALAGAGAAVALAGVILLGLWWLAGPREGRRLREALLAAVALALVANFVSSWLGAVGEVPLGAAVRDLAFVVVFLAGLSDLSNEPLPAGRIIAYAALGALVLASIDAAGGLPAVIGARTYLLYPLLLLLPAWRMSIADRLVVARGMIVMLGITAILGLIEVATRGDVLSTLGFTFDFAESSSNTASPYFAGFRRATGGLGNFLEFGLLMNIGLLLARASLRGPARAVAMTLFGVSAFLSWSRLSWALTLLIAAIPLGLIGSAQSTFQIRRLAGAVVACVVAALLLNMGPGRVVMDRISGTDRVTQRSNSTREDQLSLALSEAGTRLVGTGPGTQGAAADRQAEGPSRVVTDNGYLIWLLELGWLGFIAILTLSAILIAGLVGASAWWALSLLLVLAIANTLFAAVDSRVVLVVGFIAMRALWPSADDTADEAASDRPTAVAETGLRPPAEPAVARPSPAATRPGSFRDDRLRAGETHPRAFRAPAQAAGVIPNTAPKLAVSVPVADHSEADMVLRKVGARGAGIGPDERNTGRRPHIGRLVFALTVWIASRFSGNRRDR